VTKFGNESSGFYGRTAKGTRLISVPLGVVTCTLPRVAPVGNG
jgi:hypothetical protein